MRPLFGLLFVLLVSGAAGCGSDDPPVPAAAEGQAEEAEEAAASYDYQVYLGNAITDTLRGSATFGTVVNPETSERVFVIDLATGFDFAGGIFVARIGEAPPEPGRHELRAVPDSAASTPGEGYRVYYRQGMLRDLTSQEGSVTFETVTDTLISGTFDATLRGFVAQGSRRLPRAEVHARGRFQAYPGSPGYIVGL